MSGNHHGRHKRKEVPVAKPAVARPAAPAASYDNGPFLTFTTKLGLVLIVILSIGLSALIAFAPEKKSKDDEPAVAKVDEKEKGEKKTEKPEEKGEKKPAEKDPVEKKPAEKKPPEKEPTEKKPAEKKPPEKEPMEKEKKPADKDKEKMKEKEKEKEKEKPAEKKPADKEKEKDKDKEKEKDKEKPAEKGTEVVFEKHVLPIFTEKCGKCHGVSGKAGVDLRTMKSILKGGANGQILTKGDLKKSLIWELIDTEQMPQGDDKLTAEEKETIKKWILGGAKTAEMASK